MKNAILAVSILFFTTFSFANSVQKTSGKENDPLLDLVKDFEQAIETKDKARFLNLFYDGTVSWVGVSSQKDYSSAKRKAQAAIANGERARLPMKNFQSDPETFIDSIIARVEAPKETFENIRVHHDGEVATIYFDYEFYDGEIRKNWGKESWTLVNTEKGWKINSVIFSITRG